MKRYIFLFCMVVSSSTYGGTLFDLGATYLSDNFVTATTDTSSQYFYNVGLLFSLNKNTWGGWNYSGISMSQKATTSSDYSSQDTGPIMKWLWGRGQTFSLSIAYNLVSRGSYSSGSVNESWQGTSYFLQLGVAPEVSEGFHVGVSLNYYSAQYNKKVVNTIETTISNSRTWIFPMLSLTKQW